MQAFDVVVLLFQPPSERIWMVGTPVISDPEHPICPPADRVSHDRLDKDFEIRPRIAIDTVTDDLSGPDNQCGLIDTGSVAFVVVLDVSRGVRSRRTPLPGPRLNARLFVGTNDDITLGEFLAVP
jgi:hypothetical protein